MMLKSNVLSWVALTVAALSFGFVGGPAGAVTVGTILPDAVSYEYFGLNFANNIKTSNAVGTLDYSGQPGCGGTCTATTALGSDPSVTATVNEVTYQYTSGGGVQASLGYYVEYLNLAGTYSVDLHALDSISAPDGLSTVSTHLKLGKAGSSTSSFNNFTTTTFEEAHCVNGCPSPGFAIATAPFVSDNIVQMDANTLYYIQLDVLIGAQPSNVQVSATIDPVFSATGGTFVFSPGVSDPAASVPEPATWAMMMVGFGMTALALRRRRQMAVAIRA